MTKTVLKALHNSRVPTDVLIYKKHLKQLKAIAETVSTRRVQEKLIQNVWSIDSHWHMERIILKIDGHYHTENPKTV